MLKPAPNDMNRNTSRVDDNTTRVRYNTSTEPAGSHRRNTERHIVDFRKVDHRNIDRDNNIWTYKMPPFGILQ